jgi:hypothetical protein
VGHVALSLVLCIVLCFFKLCSIVDSLKQVFCDNTIEKQLVEVGLLYSFHGILHVKQQSINELLTNQIKA